MADGLIPEDVQQFLLQNVDSIAQWEGLLLLRAHPDQEWRSETAARSLYINEAEAEFLLGALVERRILSVETSGSTRTYRYYPQTSELDALIGRAADLYKRFLIPITHLIHSKPKSRVQAFADAFRIRKDK